MAACPSCGQPLQGSTPAQGVSYPPATSTPPGAPPQPYQYPPSYGKAPQGDAPGGRSRPMGWIAAFAAVLLLALVEGLVIVFLLIGGQRGTGPADTSAGVTQTQPQDQSQSQSPDQVQNQNSTPGDSGGSDLPRGRVGERVESAGIAITVVQVVNEPDPEVASILDLRDDQKYLAMEVILENNSGDSIFYTSATFKLRDKDDFEYSQVPLSYRFPELDFGTLANREKVRGYVDYVLPKDTAGLRLIYQNGGVAGYQTIYIDLGQ
jgi:hypothetical protein